MGCGSTESQKFMSLAQQADENGKHDEAIKLLTKAIKNDPQNAQLHKRLAQLHDTNGNHNAAVKQFRYAIAAQPDDIESYVDIAKIFYQRGQLQHAENAVQFALKQAPEDVDSLFLHAQILEQQNRSTVAAERYRQILGIQPDHTAAKLQLAMNCLKSNSPEKAAPLLRAVCHCAQSTGPQKTEARWALGMTYAAIGRWNDAATNLETALPELQQPNATHLYQLANAQFRAGHFAAAKINLQRTLELEPRHASAIQLATYFRADTNAPQRRGPIPSFNPSPNTGSRVRHAAIASPQ